MVDGINQLYEPVSVSPVTMLVTLAPCSRSILTVCVPGVPIWLSCQRMLNACLVDHVSPPLGCISSTYTAGLRDACVVLPYAPMLIAEPLGAGSLLNESARLPRSITGDVVASFVGEAAGTAMGKPVPESSAGASEPP